MSIEINGREYQCWHELGHAVATLIWGGSVEFVELLGPDHSFGLARARCRATPQGRPMALCGGFAAECLLLKTGQLPAVKDLEMTQILLENSAIDREMFHNKPRGSSLSREETDHFMDLAIKTVVPRLARFVPQMKILVDELLVTQKVSGDRIKEVLGI